MVTGMFAYEYKSVVCDPWVDDIWVQIAGPSGALGSFHLSSSILITHSNNCEHLSIRLHAKP